MFRNLISLYDGFDIKIMRYDGLLKKLIISFLGTNIIFGPQELLINGHFKSSNIAKNPKGLI